MTLPCFTLPLTTISAASKKLGQVEMRQVVNLHHLFETILSHSVFSVVNSSIENQIVERVISHVELLNKSSDRIEACEV